MSDRPMPFVQVLGVALAAVAATTAVFAPLLLLDGGEEPPGWLWLVWVVLLAAAAPAAAAVTARRLPAGANTRLMALAGVPQIVLVVTLARLDVWLDVRSGYLLADSGEESMAYGIVTGIGCVVGGFLAILVGVAAVLGARHRTSRVKVTSEPAPLG